MVGRETTILNLLYPTPRVGTTLDLPCESSIGIVVKIVSQSQSVVIETHTPELDCLIEGLRIDRVDDIGEIVESQFRSSISKLASQCREISKQLTKYANSLEHAAKKEISEIDEKLQQAIKNSKNSSQHGNSVLPREVNRDHRTSKSSISSLTPDLSLFE